MSEESKAVVRRFVELLQREATRRSGRGVRRAFRLPRLGRDGDVHGLEAFTRALQSFFEAFPDFEDSIEDLIAEGDLVAGRFTARGTHEGLFAGVSATGRRVAFQGINMYRVRDGKIAASGFKRICSA